MAVAGLTITLEQVLSDAKEIDTSRTKFYADLQDIQRKMQSLNNSWKSDTATNLLTSFKSLNKVFNSYNETVGNYSKFLRSTVQSYRSMEQRLNSNASQFR